MLLCFGSFNRPCKVRQTLKLFVKKLLPNAPCTFEIIQLNSQENTKTKYLKKIR